MYSIGDIVKYTNIFNNLSRNTECEIISFETCVFQIDSSSFNHCQTCPGRLKIRKVNSNTEIISCGFAGGGTPIFKIIGKKEKPPPGTRKFIHLRTA